MNNLTIAFLVSSMATAVNIQGENAPDSSNKYNSKQAPTIEDRLDQLEQDQQDLTGRVDALSKEIGSLQLEIKGFYHRSGESNGKPSQEPAFSSAQNDGSVNQTPGAPNDGTANEPTVTEGASYDIFYDRLQSEGSWFNDPTYGYVWQPSTASADPNWRPYTDGRWVYTDRGWTWVSNENFGWAAYHYGRWARLSNTGWIWVPGDKWAPAWVSWRQSDDYLGWAPLPPEAESEQDVEIGGWADNYYNIGPAAYVFLKTTDLANQSYRSLVVSPQENLDIIDRTKNVTNISYGKAGVIANGPNYDQLVQRSNVRIDRYRLNYVQQDDPKAQFGVTARGSQLQVLGPVPRLQRAATVEPKIAGNIAKTQVDRGWQGIDETEAKQLKQTWEKQAPVPASLPASPALPRPQYARAARQDQRPSQQPATENRESNATSPTQQSNQRPNEERIASPSPSQNEKAPQPEQQPPAANENRNGELKQQGERPQSTPPAPSPSPARNEKPAQSEQQPPAANENRNGELEQGERPQSTPPAPNPSPARNEKPAQSEQQPPAANENRNGELKQQGERPQSTPPAPSPSPARNEKPAQSEQQPPAANENRNGELKQGDRPQSIPPAPSPSPEKERSRKAPEQGPSLKENRLRQQGDGERGQPTSSRDESPQSRNQRPVQSEEQDGRGGNRDQESPGSAGGANHRGDSPQKDEKATRDRTSSEETPSKQEEQRMEGDQNSNNANAGETERPRSLGKPGHGPEQSGNERPGGKKRLDAVEKKRLELSVPQER